MRSGVLSMRGMPCACAATLEYPGWSGQLVQAGDSFSGRESEEHLGGGERHGDQALGLPGGAGGCGPLR